MSNNLRYFWPAILWAIFILLICNMQMGKVGESHMFFTGFDKITHCGLFFVLTVFYCNGFLRKRRLIMLSILHVIGITLLMIIYGGIIELLQLYIFTWRSGDWADLFADSIGVGMGMFSAVLITSAVKKIKL